MVDEGTDALILTLESTLAFQITDNIRTSTIRLRMHTGQMFTIPYYEGLRPIRKLPLQLLNAKLKAQLVQRGRTFKQIALGAHYMHYTGAAEWSSCFGTCDGP